VRIARFRSLVDCSGPKCQWVCAGRTFKADVRDLETVAQLDFFAERHLGCFGIFRGILGV
jgi:hypothetical protein